MNGRNVPMIAMMVAFFPTCVTFRKLMCIPDSMTVERTGGSVRQQQTVSLESAWRVRIHGYEGLSAAA